MPKKEYHLHDGKKGAAIAVRIVPRARKNEIVEILNDGTVRVRLTSNPADDNVNEVLSEYLANVLGINKSYVEVVAGQAGRDKLISIINMNTTEAHNKILENIS